MRVAQAPWSSTLALALTASLAQAQYLINELSFGYGNSISPQHNGVVPGFSLQGTPNMPDILSNKIILTPVAPGNQRGAVWSDRQLMHSTWIADLDFRVNGPERGGGNLNIWLTSGGASDIGTNSVYTVGRFDGLVLVVDMHGGSGGMIRGFLNDRTTDYKSQSDISGLAFGHCSYPYRNLGRPSQIKMRQTSSSFKVEVDGRLCFESDKISVPAGYQFGITAASADNPDSFEVFKLVVMSDSLHPEHSYTQTTADQNQAPMSDEQQKPKPGQPEHVTYRRGGFTTSDNKADDPYEADIPDAVADTITSSKSQFADLHNRLQSVNHHISTIFRTVSKHSQMNEHRHMELSQMLDDIKKELRRLDTVNDLSSKIQNLEKEMRLLRSDVNLQVKNSEHALKGFMSDHHATLSSNIINAAPGHGKLIAVIIGSQVVLAVGYLLYKRRRNSMPKKYL